MNYDALSHEARELYLWIENTAEIHEQMVVPSVRTLARHFRRGGYDAARAVKLWRRVVDCGAKDYAKMFCFERSWNKVFSVSDREQCAAYLEEVEREAVCENAKEVMK